MHGKSNALYKSRFDNTRDREFAFHGSRVVVFVVFINTREADSFMHFVVLMHQPT